MTTSKSAWEEFKTAQQQVEDIVGAFVDASDVNNMVLRDIEVEFRFLLKNMRGTGSGDDARRYWADKLEEVINGCF